MQLCSFEACLFAPWHSLCVYSCPREVRGVWLGLSDVKSQGKLRWVNGSEAQEGEEGPSPRSPIARGNVCVSLDQRGQTSSHPCNAKRAYVCQYGPQGRCHVLTQLHARKNMQWFKCLETCNQSKKMKTGVYWMQMQFPPRPLWAFVVGSKKRISTFFTISEMQMKLWHKQA